MISGEPSRVAGSELVASATRISRIDRAIAANAAFDTQMLIREV
jgi:hypothetical protein